MTDTSEYPDPGPAPGDPPPDGYDPMEPVETLADPDAKPAPENPS